MSLQAKWVHTLRTEYWRTCREFGVDSIHAQNALRDLQRESAHLTLHGQRPASGRGGHMSFQPSSSDVFIWPNGDWCYRYDDHSWRSDDFRVLAFGTCAFNALFEDFGGDGVAFLRDYQP